MSLLYVHFFVTYFCSSFSVVEASTASCLSLSKSSVVGIALADDDKAIPRHGYTVEADGQVIGEVTTGYRTIMTDKSVCVALVDAKYKELGTKVQVRIHKKLHEGTVVKKRFYDKSYKK